MLAMLLYHQGDLAGARPLLECALAIVEKALGPEHPQTALRLSNLAVVLNAQGDLAGARRFYERTLAIWLGTEHPFAAAMGPEHPSTNRVRCELSRVLLMSAQPTETLTLGETALTAHDKVLGPNHVWTKDSARVTADALDALGRTEEANALREQYGVTSSDAPKPS